MCIKVSKLGKAAVFNFGMYDALNNYCEVKTILYTLLTEE